MTIVGPAVNLLSLRTRSSTDTIVLDNYLLMHLAQHAESGNAHGLYAEMLDMPSLHPVRDNSMLRAKLMSALYEDRNVADHLKLMQQHSGLRYRLFESATDRRMRQQALEELQSQRDKAFREYEMLRKLTCTDNITIQLQPTIVLP